MSAAAEPCPAAAGAVLAAGVSAGTAGTAGTTGTAGSAVAGAPGAGASVDREAARRARVGLSLLVEPGHRDLGDLVLEVGPDRALERLLAGAASSRLVRAIGPRRGTSGQVDKAIDAATARAGQLGVRVVVPEDEEWPAQLDELVRISSSDDEHTYPPMCLWVRGQLPLADALRRSVALVGARAATTYGVHVATELGYGLADRGWSVVSGGAYGIDAAAHRGAIAAGGVTVAVLACGIDTTYPMAHANLFDAIVEDGLILSEWPPGTTPQRHRFLVRNRVIAAATRGTVVVEAAVRSGARFTARRAYELDRPLMAVPGPVTSAMSVGTHLLMRDLHARVVARTADVIEEVGSIGEDLESQPRAPQHRRDALDALAARVLDAVPRRRAAPLERIAAEAGVCLADVRRALPALVLYGFVEHRDGGFRLTPAASGQVSAEMVPDLR